MTDIIIVTTQPRTIKQKQLSSLSLFFTRIRTLHIIIIMMYTKNIKDHKNHENPMSTLEEHRSVLCTTRHQIPLLKTIAIAASSNMEQIGQSFFSCFLSLSSSESEELYLSKIFCRGVCNERNLVHLAQKSTEISRNPQKSIKKSLEIIP